MMFLHFKHFLFFTALGTVAVLADPTLTVTPEKSSAIYQPGEAIIWDVKVAGDEAAPVTQASYVLLEGGAKGIGQGNLTFTGGAATIQTTLNEPGTILATVTAPVPAGKSLVGTGGAAVAPDQIQPSMPVPDDFDAFWKSKIDALAAIPENVVLEKGDSGNPNVDYWKITLDNINGTHIQGQIARPVGDKKCPAMLLTQWAGVYPLQKSWVVSHASEGWLVMNILAHDLPIDQPKAFYDAQNTGALKNYTAIGKDDREKSYFLRMFLGVYRSVEYLSERPDWDGKTLVATGTSQGGLQSFVAAGLDPKVTAMVVLVPAGCDDSAREAGRNPGWPFWMNHLEGLDKAKVLDTSRYFDAVNFASRVKCPALVGLGLVDTTAPPSGIFAALSQMKGPKEVLVLPDSDHAGRNKSQVPFYARSGTWFAALRTTGTPPPATP